ncbi:uncharacterized protein N7482_001478 [Penicillium canariense]|uniref:Zn(2)-C6 fungal-type domain-containing protein n=1 Tax=Penicillium canariense TaxID=189055 RepID=A0A9W9IJT1_9EURO|nr:uncharacterized protein N7482_001478 [Penicillium canariense]KAJ5175601.1 hypothetical protein N7482_001478 [Penicillium canariense]
MFPSGSTDQSEASGTNKVAIPRAAAPAAQRGRRRSVRACEACRQRKIKCDGDRPTCGQCTYHNNRCVYEDVKRVREQKLLGLLSQRVERYESLLHDLQGDADAPTARRIRKVLRITDSKCPNRNEDSENSDSDSDSSVGSLDAIDLIDEDLNRNENTRAAGFFGKNSDVAWMQRLEDGVEHRTGTGGYVQSLSSGSSAGTSQQPSPFGVPAMPQPEKPDRGIPIAMMNYHLDDLDIPVVGDSDPLAVPPRETADQYFDAYMAYVHPMFSIIRKPTFTSQYRQFYSGPAKPPKKWLAILNMIFAIGCRYCKLISPTGASAWEDGLVYLTRARQLALHENILFEHTDLQQIQLETLVAIYLLCLGQVNRASKFSSMALRSGLSLGINLHITDGRTNNASKEARCRLWWSIYSLEHLLTSMHGRASCIGESLCSLPPPVPIEEEFFEQPDVCRLLQDRTFRETQLRSTLFELPSQLQGGLTWMADCKPCPSLLFYHLTDLALISQAALNNVYSVQGIREDTNVIEYRLQKYILRLDRWLAKVPASYKFTLPDAGPWHLNHAQLDDENAPFARERVCLAMSYYSARVILCRPCLSPPHPSQAPNSPSAQGRPHTKLKADMAMNCLQAACSLISILPETVDFAWLARVTPWWSVLHFIMQATASLLLGLSYCSLTKQNSVPKPGTDAPPFNYQALLESDLDKVVVQAKKALQWIHAMASIDRAARRAFLLCDDVVAKIAPGLNIDLRGWPSAKSLGGTAVQEQLEAEAEAEGRMEGLEDPIDSEDGGSFS